MTTAGSQPHVCLPFDILIKGLDRNTSSNPRQLGICNNDPGSWCAVTFVLRKDVLLCTHIPLWTPLSAGSKQHRVPLGSTFLGFKSIRQGTGNIDGGRTMAIAIALDTSLVG